MHHGAGNNRWRRSRRAVDSSPQARGQCQSGREHHFDCRLSEHLHIHALGEPENTHLAKGTIAARKGERCKVERRPFCIRPCHPDYSTTENLADDRPASFGNKEISLWLILFVAFVGGFFSGFLGVGAGYIRMPSMVYVLGIPTHLAVGTDLFEIIISASYGTFSHAVKGNVDILIALVMHTGAAIGAQIGAISTQYFAGPKIRLAFVPLPLIGAGIVIYTMFSGHKL